MKPYLLLTLGVLSSVLAAAPLHAAPGETWEVVTKAEMSGMAVPPSTATICLRKDAPPNPSQLMQQEDCVVSDLKTSGNKTTWKMRCNNEGVEMNGTGEMITQSGGYQGMAKIAGVAEGQSVNMTASFKGKRLGAACDTSAPPVVATSGMEAYVGMMNRQMGLANQQMDSAMAEQCEVANYQAAELISNRFFGPRALCAGKEKFACKPISKEVTRKTEVYLKLAKHDDTSETNIASICGIDMQAATRSICKLVDDGNYEEMSDYCPKEAQAIAAARSSGAAGQQTESSLGTINSGIDKTQNAIDTAKRLKGLMGF